ncbi:ATP-dependent helicase [Sulfuricaulis limicola]|uniref:ATP-dependent helicase n=1 Tax=Sulfuricaulis limicola TaxID=1620215 RepID=A0A1B4XHF2_9GAMM|nr:ATP-dependent helicase HrpB [Sulfuricaulis limicola]BAV34222.1 ATP-dependent helicase [Sulfuricaulis limicola]
MDRLPIDDALPELRATLAANAAVVLQAPPGAGKTTHVPLALLNEPWLAGRSILILEPRRLAARAACARMSTLRGESPGQTVGYRIRFESKVSAQTRIEVLTEGILTRRLQSDPELKNVGLVIFDEFHERHLHADLALALCLDSQKALREDLKILVMSATLDGAAVSKLLNDAPVVTSQGRSYPVDIHYLPRDPEGPLPQTVCDSVVNALEKHEGDVLVFLPGAWEIRRTQELLQARIGTGAELFPLYGDLPWEAQDRAIQPGAGRRKIVLATPIAETSLTIEGVRVVVDGGFARVPQFDPGSGLSRLTTVRISRASSEQRAGRAGRLAPGVCYRLWSETTQRGLVPQSLPEIRGADLAPLALELAAWGVRDVRMLSWLDPPPEAAFNQAHELLAELDAVDADGRATETGRAMARLPLHPRLSHMLFAAQQLGQGTLACDIAALLSERDILTGEARRSADFVQRVEALQAFRQNGRAGAQSHQADANGCTRVNQAAQQFQRLLSSAKSAPAMDVQQTGLLLALAYPDRVALARAPGETRYLLASGRGARLHESEMRLRQPCIVAANVSAGDAQGRVSVAGGRMPGATETEGLIYSAAPLNMDTLREHLAAHILLQDIVRWDAPQQVVIARREERFGALVLDSKPLAKADPERIRAAMLEGIRRLGIETLPWTRETREWQTRVLSLRQWLPDENWPDVSDAALSETLAEWLGPYLDGMLRRDHLARLDLLTILKSRLDWDRGRRLEEGAPTHVEVPSGSHLRLEYFPGESPVLRVKLQEMFGLADTPRVAWGKIPVTLHLLSPAQRPIQVTQDLRGFWERTYPEVKKELKGKYPKHPWPDDPWTATPTRRARRRTDR